MNDVELQFGPPDDPFVRDLLRELRDVVWVRPATCDSSACFQVHIGLTDVTVRNSQRPDQIVVFDLAEWAAFVADAKSGRFDVG